MAARFINLGKAAFITNVNGDNMAPYEGCVCRNNGVTAFVSGGDYYLSPDAGAKEEKLREGFKDRGFMVLCSIRPDIDAPAGHEKEWAELRRTRM